MILLLSAVELTDYSGRMLAETAAGTLACPVHAQGIKPMRVA
jgi:hypothetical protein